MEKIIAYLKEKNLKRTISYEELLNLFSTIEYEALARKISSLVEEGKLKIVNKKNTNGRNPMMYMKYSIIENKDTYEREVKEIKALNAALSISYYINRPEEYKKHRAIIMQLNQFMTFSKEKLHRQISINERSLQIWGKEKLLRDSSIATILKNLGITLKMLNVYNTPEPFFYYLHNETIPSILIIENKDTWFSIRKYLKETGKRVLGLSIGLLIYGEGKKIESSIEFLEEEELSFFKDATIYYWGDLDFEGIDIYLRLKNKISLRLFIEAYNKMVDDAKLEGLQEMKTGQRENEEIEFFLINFNEERRDRIKEMLLERKYIPQEIIYNFETERDKDYEFK